MSICLEQRGRRPLQRRCEHHWSRNVATRSEHDVRPAPAQDLQAGRRRGCGRGQRTHERHSGSPRQAGAAERVELVTGLRNEPRLDAIRRPGEAHPDAAFLQLLGDGERRQHVSRRAPGRDHALQLSLLRHDRPRC
jgi:hypothetical protein